MQNKKYFSMLAIGLISISLAAAVPVFAQSSHGFGWGIALGKGGQTQKPGVVGTVSAINGNTLTVTGKQGFNKTTTATTFTVDATNAKITKNNAASTVASIAVGDIVAVQGTVSGNNVTATSVRDGVMMGGQKPGSVILGTVSSISGTTLVVISKVKEDNRTSTSYTVDASNAAVTKNGIKSSVSNVLVGDTVMIQGTINGTNVTAKTIKDGVPQSQPAIQGNGQPVVAGKITAISGSTITITNKSNVTYTIDATSAKFFVTGVASPTISNVAVGDNLTVQGTVNGNSVTASSVIDQKAKGNNSTNNNEGNNKRGFMGGMMNGIGNFFKRLFGF